jgi:hypothetical protein
MKRSLLRLVFISLLVAQAAPHAAWAQMKAAPPLSGVKGKVQSFTGSSLDILTPSGVVHVNIKQPVTTYKQIPSDLSHVTSTSFVGAASIKQADGTELATQIKIFPPELRGAGEGSSMMDAAPGAMTHSRMTNGSVSRPATSHSRMTNGTGTERQRHDPGNALSGRRSDDLRASECPSYGSRAGKGDVCCRRYRLCSD